MATGQEHLEMHVRVKRRNTVLFLYVDPSDTLYDVKAKIEAVLGQPADRQRLVKAGAPLTTEGSKLVDLQIEHDDELGLIYMLEGSDEWEAVEAAASTAEGKDKPSATA